LIIGRGKVWNLPSVDNYEQLCQKTDGRKGGVLRDRYAPREVGGRKEPAPTPPPEEGGGGVGYEKQSIERKKELRVGGIPP